MNASISLEHMPANQLRPAEPSFRDHPKRQRDAVSASIAECGFAAPLIARQTPQGPELIDGHLRAQLAGDKLIPVIFFECSDQTAHNLRLLLNATSEMAIDDRVARYQHVKRCAASTFEGDALLRDLKRRWRPRAACPTTPARYVPRRHILVDCRDEEMQRDLFDALQRFDIPCRLLTL
jgi:hypothetical protein